MMEDHETEAKRVISLEPDIKAKIGRQLRVLYAEVVAQGVPDRFAEILKQLDEPKAGETEE
jgi:hypothetical protein